MPRLPKYDHLGDARFVTFCCYRHHQLLAANGPKQLFLEVLFELRIRHRYLIYGYVVMPDHVHLVMRVPESAKLSPIIAEIKSQSASRILARGLVTLPDDCWVKKDGQMRRAFWQPRFFDHNCRNLKSALEKINYCHNNPVKRGLVSDAREWPWSSFAWYEGRNIGPIRIDEV